MPRRAASSRRTNEAIKEHLHPARARRACHGAVLCDTGGIQKCVLAIPSTRATDEAITLGTHLVQLLERVPCGLRNSHQVIREKWHGVPGGGGRGCAGGLARHEDEGSSCGGSALRAKTCSAATRGCARQEDCATRGVGGAPRKAGDGAGSPQVKAALRNSGEGGAGGWCHQQARPSHVDPVEVRAEPAQWPILGCTADNAARNTNPKSLGG